MNPDNDLDSQSRVQLRRIRSGLRGSATTRRFPLFIDMARLLRFTSDAMEFSATSERYRGVGLPQPAGSLHWSVARIEALDETMCHNAVPFDW